MLSRDCMHQNRHMVREPASRGRVAARSGRPAARFAGAAANDPLARPAFRAGAHAQCSRVSRQRSAGRVRWFATWCRLFTPRPRSVRGNAPVVHSPPRPAGMHRQSGRARTRKARSACSSQQPPARRPSPNPLSQEQLGSAAGRRAGDTCPFGRTPARPTGGARSSALASASTDAAGFCRYRRIHQFETALPVPGNAAYVQQRPASPAAPRAAAEEAHTAARCPSVKLRTQEAEVGFP